MATYPTIRATDLVPLQRVQAALAADPSYLDQSDCPYTADVRDFLRSLSPIGAATAEAEAIFGSGTDSLDTVLTQINAIYAELNSLKVQDAGERIQIAKAKAGLIEKLVTLSERVESLKEQTAFKKAVIAAVDSLGVAERDAFLSRLEAAA